MKKLRSIHEGIVGWSCEQHPNREWPHKNWFFWECAGPGDAVHDPKWLEERAQEELRERKLAEFFDLYPEYKGREEEVIKILDRFY